MGFSLEAMIVIPCCLTLLAGSIGQAGPVSANLQGTAVIAGRATLASSETEVCCRHFVFEEAELSIPAVETHPQKVVEALSLARDLTRTLGRDSP